MNRTENETIINNMRQNLDQGCHVINKAEVLAFVSHAMETRTPAAIIRFGEGEGRLLAAEPNDGDAVEVARKKIRRQTGQIVDDSSVQTIRENIIFAFEKADILGIHADGSFNEEHLGWQKLIEAEYQKRSASGLRLSYTSHCLLSNWIRDDLKNLVRNHQFISLITCRDLRELFKDEYGIDKVNVYKVPSQFAVRNVDGEFEAELHGTSIWPHYIKMIESQLTVRERGEIFLVGAGLFGKHLCIRIKEMGGIAIDLGSCLDGLADKVTRGIHKKNDISQTTGQKNNIKISEMPTMPEAIIDYLSKSLSGTSCLLEYGSGGCSRLATKLGIKQIFSVDSDEGLLTSVHEHVLQDNPKVEFYKMYCNIGPVGSWGRPLDASNYAKWPRYSTDVWKLINRMHVMPDFVLIDGRFRVSCFLASIMHLRPGTKILFDDYVERRAKYSIVEKFAKKLLEVDRAAVFEVDELLDLPSIALELAVQSVRPG